MKLDFIKNKNTIMIGVAIVGITVIGFLAFYNPSEGFSFSGFSGILGQSSQEIGQKAIDYINKNGLSASQATLVSASDESGLIKIKIKIGENEFDSYISKDGKLLFPQAITITDSTTASAEKEQAAPTEIVKTDSPKLDAYVVSKCPYGLQMQRVVAEAIKDAPDLAKYVDIKYIGAVVDGKITAMHGDAEAQENLRQICIREEQPAKYWNYISCHIKAGDTSGCESSAGVDSASLNACASTASRGLAYAQEDFDLNLKYSVTGSPTLMLGDAEVSEFDFGGRTADAIKKLVCAGFNTEPNFCSTTLNTADAAISFSETYAATAGSDSGASCE